MDREHQIMLQNFIATMATAPSTQLDKAFAGKCLRFSEDPTDPVQFLRDLRDMCVFAGASSNFVVISIGAALETCEVPEEDPEAAEKRRSNLEERWGAVPTYKRE